MHRLVFAVILLLLPNTVLRAQRFRAGVAAGFISSDVDGTRLGNNHRGFRKAGFTFGGFVNGKLSEQNSLQFEILYAQKGSWQPPDTADPSYYLLQLDYIEVPLLFHHQMHISVHSRSTDRFTLEFGPSFGTLIRINQNGLYYQNGTYISGYFDNDNFRKTDLALNIGVSYNFYNNFIFDVRYGNSIIPVIKHPLPMNTYFWKTFTKGDNLAFSFTLRYLFQKKNKAVTGSVFQHKQFY